ncbi:large ribosomal subunit protein eL36-like [Lycaon pictus]
MGLNKGHKMAKNVSKLRHSGPQLLAEHPKFVQDMIQQGFSFALYEQLTVGPFKDKWALKVIKKRSRLTSTPGKKQEALRNVLVTIRKLPRLKKDSTPAPALW